MALRAWTSSYSSLLYLTCINCLNWVEGLNKGDQCVMLRPCMPCPALKKWELLMCQLCVDACVAERQEQGGTRGRENEVGGERKKKRGRAQDSPSGIRTSRDCSAAAGAQPTRRETAQGTGTQSLQHSLLSCRDARARVQLLSYLGGILEVAFCLLFFSGCTTLWQRSSMTGRSAVCPKAARRARAGYATGEEVRSGRQWHGARSREVGWGAHMELCAAHGTDAKSMICASEEILES